MSCDITNTGNVEGAEVVQLYVGYPSAKFGPNQRVEPIKQLKGFEKYYLKPSETITASFTLTDSDLSYWDIDAKEWKLKVGSAAISVGTSSGDIRQTATLIVSN